MRAWLKPALSAPCQQAHLAFLLAMALLSCAPQAETSEPRPSIYSGPNHFHDLTDFNYVTVWVTGLPSTADLSCELNGQANSCLAFIRPTKSGVLKEAELYLPALPSGTNHFEIQRPNGSPLAVTDFVVCRRTLEIDMGPGPDNSLETPDDPIGKVRRRAWKNGLAAWEALSEGTDSTATEVYEHAWAFRTTDTVRRYSSTGELLELEHRLFTFHGIPISSETYSPIGGLTQYQRFCTRSELTFAVSANEDYSDGACPGFVPSYQETFANAGSDQTWHTEDDSHYHRTDFGFRSGSDWLATASATSEWLRTVDVDAPTNATRTGWALAEATVMEEIHERDPARPGLRLRTILTRKVPRQHDEQVGYRRYEYQCIP